MKKSKAKKQEIHFTAHERRVLEIPQREPQYGPEAIAVRKIIDSMPWILEVAEHRFDKVVADGYVLAEGMKIHAEVIKRGLVENYNKRMKEKK
jgi:hypothetical protein